MIATLNCMLLYHSVIEQFTDENVDHFLQFAFGSHSVADNAASIASLEMAIIHIMLIIVISICCIFSKKRYIILEYNYNQSNARTKVCRFISLLLLFLLLISYVLSFSTFYANHVLFQLSLIIIMLAYMEWIVFIINGNNTKNGLTYHGRS